MSSKYSVYELTMTYQSARREGRSLLYERQQAWCTAVFLWVAMRAAASSLSKSGSNNNNADMSLEEGRAFLPPKLATQIVYSPTTQPNPSRSRWCCSPQLVCLGLFVCFLVTGLVALEMMRSSELLRLREELDTLRTDFTNFKHRVLEDDLLEAIRAFEQQSYREDQAAASISTSPSPADEDQDSSVADDDDDIYDEDEDEEDDDEDTYDDEDHTRQRRDVELHPPVVARRPMVLGRTEDGVPVLSHSYAAIKEMNRTGGLSSLRLYDSLARTDDNNGETTTTTEDPIKLHHRISPLWVPPKWKKTGEKTSYHKRRSPQQVTPAPWPVIQRRSRVMQTPEEGEAVSTTFDKDAVLPPRGEIVMRVLQPESSENNNPPQARESHPGAFARAPTLRSHDPLNPNGDAVAVKPRRNHRRKFNRNGTRNHARVTEFDEAPPHAGPRRLAAHFAANATMYALGHPNFAGNGRLRHPGVFSDWSPSPWMRDLGMDSHFVLSDGVLTVRQPGLYFFYSQIYYVDDHDNNGYNVYVNGAVRLQCTTMTHSSSAVTKINTCYTGSVIFLRDGDTVYLRDISGLRYSMFEPEKSFFGLFRLAEARIR